MTDASASNGSSKISETFPESQISDVMSAMRHAETLLQQGQVAVASALIFPWLERQPKYDWLRRLSGRIAVAEGRVDFAIQLMRETLDVCPDFDIGWLDLAYYLRELGKLDDASEIMISALERFPDNPRVIEAAAAVATSRARQGASWSDSIDLWRRAIDLGTAADPRPYLSLATAYSEAGRREDADDTLRLAAAHFPNRHEAHAQRAANAISRSEFDVAAEICEGIRQNFPDQVLGYELGADAARQLGQVEIAEALLKDARVRFPQNHSVARRHAEIAMAAGDWKSAYDRWTVLRKMANRPDIGIGPALPYVAPAENGDDIDRGEMLALAALIGASERPYDELNEIVMRLQREALRDPARLLLADLLFKSVLRQITVVDCRLYFNMANVYSFLGKPEQSALLASLAMHFPHPDTFAITVSQNLFKYFSRRGRHHEALDVFANATRRAPEYSVAWHHELLPSLNHLKITYPDFVAALDLSDPNDAAPSGLTVHPRYPEAIVDIPRFSICGGKVPFALARVGTTPRRPPVTLVRLDHGQLLIANNAILVKDRVGKVLTDLSICMYPEFFDAKYSRAEPPPHVSADIVVVISDLHPAPNLCHFLYDQISRLALFQEIMPLSEVTVVGPPVNRHFHMKILEALNIKEYIDSDQMLSLSATQLWLSTTSKSAMNHPAHLGAPWALSFIQSLFPPPSNTASRRLYISRSLAARKISNEDLLIELLSQYGFISENMETLDFLDQVNLFRESSHVVGAHGAGLTNLVFCSKGAHILEIFPPLFGTASYAIPAAMCGHRYAAVVGRDAASNAPAYNDPSVADTGLNIYGGRDILIDLTLVREWLETSCR